MEIKIQLFITYNFMSLGVSFELLMFIAPPSSHAGYNLHSSDTI